MPFHLALRKIPVVGSLAAPLFYFAESILTHGKDFAEYLRKGTRPSGFITCDVYSQVLSPVVFRGIIKAGKGVSCVSYVKVTVGIFFLIKGAVSEMEVSRDT